MTKNNSLPIPINTSLLLIVVMAAVVRMAFLAQAPISLSVDEASNGYDAYSILGTLRDRYGAYLPLFVRGFDDSRETLFIFLLIPFIKLFGLNEFAIRLCAATLGTLTVPVVYFLVKECFNNKKIALLSALFFTLSPWHIFFSRIAFSAILVPLLFTLAILFFLKSFKSPNYLPLSGLTFGLSLFTYASARVFIPLFLLGLIFIFRQHLWSIKKQTVIAIILFMLIFIPLFQIWITPEGMARASETGIETNPFRILLNYLSYFEPVFLFFRGDPNPRRSVSTVGVGELYSFEVLTVLAGIFFLSKEKIKERSILFLWLILYPIPAALTESSHAIRSIVGVPLFSIFSGYGFFKISAVLSADKTRYFKFIAPLVITTSAIAYLKFYFDYSQYTIAHVSKNWQYGMKEAITYAEISPYSCVLVSDKFWRPNIYILFYTQYPPAAHQRSPIYPSATTGYSVGKYQIVSISQPPPLNTPCLSIIKPDEIQEISNKEYKIREINLIKAPNGIEQIRVVEIRP